MFRPKKSVPLKNFTYLKIGGLAKFFFVAKTKEELIESIKWAREKKLEFLVIGGGSNLLVSDEGFPGLVIKNEASEVKINQNTVVAESGTILSDLVNTTIQNNLQGMQSLAGIPGTLGGAIFGNAGAFGQTLSDRLTKIITYDPQKDKFITFQKNDCYFNYRTSIFKTGNLIILEAFFKLEKGDHKILEEEAKKILNQRSAKFSPKIYCPGSFFQNIPVGKIPEESLKLIPQEKITSGQVPVAYLLEKVGAKGMKIGQIQVSQNHANLIVNLGGGCACDVWQLASDLARKVKEKFGVDLEPEVQLINLPPLNSNRG